MTDLSNAQPGARFLSTRQVMELLGAKHARTVHRLVERGELKYAHKIDGQTGAYLFARGDVKTYLRKRASIVAAEAQRLAERAESVRGAA